MIARLGSIFGVVILLLACCSGAALATEPADADPPISRNQEILEIKQQIRSLERRVDQLENENSDLKKSNAELKTQTLKEQSATTEKLQTMQSQLQTEPTPASFVSAVDRFLGRYRFTLVGGAAGDFIYDRQTSNNTFALDVEPIILWQLSDQLLMEFTIEANLPSGSSAEFQMPVADVQYTLTDYMTLLMGIYDQPFGDWYEDQSPFWVNRFVTAPLPYGINAIVPPTDVGIQLRGGYQWGHLGQTADYTITVANGPGYTQSTCTDNTPPSILPTCPHVALVGDTLGSPNNIKLNTHTPAFGARMRVYPLPVDSRFGRLELGGSTYDGKWQNGYWYNAWGVDFNYFRENLQTRGEWIQTYRQMPSPQNADNRQGWYVQAGYFLTGLRLPLVPQSVNWALGKLEPVVRYSGVNQRAIVQSEIITTPEIGFSGSPSIFTPHARQVALGLDYWLTPSTVWQNEFDLEMPGQGGYYSDTGAGIRATPNDRAFLSQFAVGF